MDTLGNMRARRRFLASLLAVVAVVATGCSSNVGPQDFMSPEGPISRRADSLWDITFAIATVIFVIVQGLLVFALVRFRHRPGRRAAQFHGNTKVEIVLTLVPALILAGLAVPTVKAIADLSEKPTDALEITVTARQFWWQYDYPDLGVVTANEMHVPVDQPVYLTLKGDAGDVIHSFWIPKLTGTQDVVPGRENNMQFEAEEPGVYWGQCKEYCGLSHANMRLRVIAMTPDDFDRWVSEQQADGVSPTDSLAQQGEEIFMNTCTNCHAIKGTDAQGTTGPDLTHFASRDTFAGAMFDRTDENLAAWIRNPAAVKPGALMPDYGLSEEEIRAVVAYLQGLE